MYQPCGLTDGPEDAAVAEDDDGKRDEEDKDEEQHRVRTDRRGEGHVVPGAGSHQAFWHIRTWGEKTGLSLFFITENHDLKPSLHFLSVVGSRAVVSWLLGRFLMSQNMNCGEAVKETSSEQEMF